MAADDDFQVKSAAFLAWLQKNGCEISPAVQLADLRERGAGRGVGAFVLPISQQLFLFLLQSCSSSVLVHC